MKPTLALQYPVQKDKKKTIAKPFHGVVEFHRLSYSGKLWYKAGSHMPDSIPFVNKNCSIDLQTSFNKSGCLQTKGR